MNKEVENKIRDKIDSLKTQKTLAFGPYDPVVWLYPDEAIELLQALDDCRKERNEFEKVIFHVETTPKNNLEHMLYDTLIERDKLSSDLDEVSSALIGILEIGKRDMTNPKYDGYFTHARDVLAKAGKIK